MSNQYDKMRFSERIGKRISKTDIQFDSMDRDTKNSIWNVLVLLMIEPMTKYGGPPKGFDGLVRIIWFNFYKEPLDYALYRDDFANDLRSRWREWSYLDVYDFVDFIARVEELPFSKEDYLTKMNAILIRELAGYRFINGRLAPITNENEIIEIERALSNTSGSKLRGANIHLNEALTKLSDRRNPDYRNSIKESISAIESLCQILSGEDKAELGKALKVLKKNIPIHGALEQGLLKIYGYTSDSDGIRHALLDEPNLDQEDALFMLISCSSFVNYLIVKANKSGINLLN